MIDGQHLERRLPLFGRTMLWASEKRPVERFIRNSGLTRSVVSRFVAGDELDNAADVITGLNARGIGGILDFLGEGVTDPAGAESAAAHYLSAIKRIDETGIDTSVSVKLTQLGLAFDKGACIDHLRRLAAEAVAVGTAIEIDMEQSTYAAETLDVYRVLQVDYPDLRVALQAYLRRTPVDLETLAPLRPRVRLVKGAYAESEEVAHQSHSDIEAQYAFLTEWLFQRGRDPAIATHNGRLLAHAKRTAAATGIGKDGFEMQMLYGVRRELQQNLADEGYRVRVYVPYGSSWYPYLMRRLAERPANLRFFLRALARD
jgi:proline dehydrogenase